MNDRTTAGPDGTTARPGRPLRRDAAENRERLLRAAWEVFAEVGQDAGVEEIAHRAGVGMGTLYRRFPTKDALLTALSDEILDTVLQRARELAEAHADGKGLEQVLTYIGSVLASHHGCLTRLWQAVPPTADTRRAELWSLLAGLLEEAQHGGEVRGDLTLSDVYLAVLSLRGIVDDTAGRAPEVWRRHLCVILAGFRPSDRALEHPPADDALVHAAVATPAARRSAAR
ncbi:TetR/AcrR family transcriptional regulator [Streptacidiphilus neutrinimicus]|uniref:TetR/AcrR family transcriptional regulator n=1 Tax=Streptacidiphilus neutrinimicus TaxID=105420 RepID=UPI0005AADFDF|nr:TetR/AcrR family transcriptional regulator [Streptacidiphilus neutrinimicus]